MMNCKTCQFQMTAYLHGEVTRRVGKQMARHIQRCPLCYAVYGQQRDVERELTHYVSLIGQEKAPRYGKMWASIQTDLSDSPKQGYQVRYGLAALMLMLALALPWTLGRGPTMLAAVPTQPSPEATPPACVVCASRSPQRREPEPEEHDAGGERQPAREVVAGRAAVQRVIDGLDAAQNPEDAGEEREHRARACAQARVRVCRDDEQPQRYQPAREMVARGHARLGLQEVVVHDVESDEPERGARDEGLGEGA